MSLSRGGGDVSTRGPIDRPPPPPRPHGLRGSLLAWAFSRVGGLPRHVVEARGAPPSHVAEARGGPWDEGGGGILFGRPLGSVCSDQQLPEAVLAMLRVLRREGPLTGGIFRRSAGVRACRKLKQRLEAGQTPAMSGQCVLVLAAVIKDFMRSIPGGVLTEELHSEWLSAMRCADTAQRLQQIRRVSSRLPASHNALLRHVMCMLHHVARRSATNQMTPRNLAVCIAPSVAPGMHWGGHVATAGAGRLSPPSPATQSRDTAQVSLLVQFLIENCEAIFGSEVTTLLGPDPDPSEPDSVAVATASGAAGRAEAAIFYTGSSSLARPVAVATATSCPPALHCGTTIASLAALHRGRASELPAARKTPAVAERSGDGSGGLPPVHFGKRRGEGVEGPLASSSATTSSICLPSTTTASTTTTSIYCTLRPRPHRSPAIFFGQRSGGGVWGDSHHHHHQQQQHHHHQQEGKGGPEWIARRCSDPPTGSAITSSSASGFETSAAPLLLYECVAHAEESYV